MFGEPSPTEPSAAQTPEPAAAQTPEPAAAQTPETAAVPPTAAADGLAMSNAANAETLDLGGRLLLRGTVSFTTDAAPEDAALSMPNVLDVYLDARPHDRLRAYAEVRMTYDPTLENGRASLPDLCVSSRPETDREQVSCRQIEDAISRGLAPSPTTFGLTQLWLKTDLDRSIYLTIGRQTLKWGASHIWNPTDFIQRQRRDPLAALDLRTGVTLIKAHLPLESQTANLYVIGLLDEARTVGDVGGAARGELAFGSAEVSLSLAKRRGEPLLLGGDLSTGVGPLDLFVEAAVAHGHHQPLPGQAARDDAFIPQLSGGLDLQLEYGDEDALTVGGEVFFNDDGLTDASLAGTAIASGRSPFYLPRTAVGLFLLALGPGRFDDTSIIATLIAHPSDKSGLGRLSVSQRVSTFLTVAPYVSAYFGDGGDLFRLDLNGSQEGAESSYAIGDLGLWLQMAM